VRQQFNKAVVAVMLVIVVTWVVTSQPLTPGSQGGDIRPGLRFTKGPLVSSAHPVKERAECGGRGKGDTNH
jgi:hypothetical protein